MAAVSAATAAPTPIRARSRLASRRTLGVTGIAVVIAGAGALWISAPASSQSTDDAYVGADATSVAPKVRGFVEKVMVGDNETVRAGQPLVRIDPEEFVARVAAATASLADAEAGVRSAQAALGSLDAEQRLSRAEVVAARTAIRSAAAQSDVAGADRTRYASLVASGAVARREAESFSAAAVMSEQGVARAKAMLLVSQEGSGVVDAKRPGLLAAVATARAKVAQARAALDLAEQDRRHATILASVNGVVGNRLVRTGDFVQAGTRLMTIVPIQALYVTANFKETQTGRMHPGLTASIDADALPGTRLRGVVDSVAPGSGSSFSLLPFEPGTGNFTKIVQRIAVRIRFSPGQPDVNRLRPGLSVTAKVNLDGP